MTGHDKLLRLGCEVAGLTHTAPPDGWDCYQIGDYSGFWMGIDHPALPAYVASLLVRQFTGSWTASGYVEAIQKLANVEGPCEDVPLCATDYQRIAAALVALGHITIDEARGGMDESQTTRT